MALEGSSKKKGREKRKHAPAQSKTIKSQTVGFVPVDSPHDAIQLLSKCGVDVGWCRPLGFAADIRRDGDALPGYGVMNGVCETQVSAELQFAVGGRRHRQP